jgi:preprotein translocase subunit SecF
VALADWAGVFGDVKLNLSMLAAFLTILGYSVNDTIVIFDRIRENLALTGRKLVTADLIDLSVNQTLSRTVLTSWTVLIVVIVLYFLGGPVLQGLSFALIIGVISGTFSSVFVASALVLDWDILVRGTKATVRTLFFPVLVLALEAIVLRFLSLPEVLAWVLLAVVPLGVLAFVLMRRRMTAK